MPVEVQAREERVAALEAAVAARTRDLQAALDQQTALLHELDHRVKNNLQLISSLMMMQARRAADPAVKAVVDGMLERLNAVATVHRRLFRSEDVRGFDLSEFVGDLVSDLAYAAGRPELTFDLRLTAVQVPAAKATSLALLISELVTNAIRHAHPRGVAGRIRLSIHDDGRDLRIEIADDGVGMGGLTGAAADDGSGFGLTIVALLGRQLQARISRTPLDPGLRTEVVLPLERLRGVP